jgi:O-antigen/teichoic acid export membrane protein
MRAPISQSGRPAGRESPARPAESLPPSPGEAGHSVLFTPAHRKLLSSSAWGLADQALISAMNFGTMVLLARRLGPAEFGAFTLAYLVLLLANSLQTALVTQPHNIIGPSLEDAGYRDYTTSAAVGQVVVAAVFTLLVLAGAAVAPAFSWHRTALLVGLATAVPAWQMQEFARRVLYTGARIRTAFLNDLISYGGQLILVLLFIQQGRLTGPLALYVIAGTSGIASLAGFWTIRSHLRGRIELRAIRESWAIGKWLSATTLANWLSNQMYPVLTAGVLGVYAIGVYRALQNLIAPTQVLANAFQMVVTPEASREHARGGPRAVGKFLSRGSLLLAVPLLLYFILAGVYARPLVTFFYSRAYAAEANLIWALGLAYLLSHAGRVLGIGLAASQDTRPMFYAQVAAAATTLSVGLWLVRHHGLEGAAYGAALTQAIQVALLAWFFHRRRSTPPVRQAA